MTKMRYKDYLAAIEFDTDDSIFVGHILGIVDRVGFHAKTVDGLRAAFHEAVDDYLEACEKIGKSPQKAFSGQLMLRVTPDVHRKAAIAAEASGRSLNQWVASVVESAADITSN